MYLFLSILNPLIKNFGSAFELLLFSTMIVWLRNLTWIIPWMAPVNFDDVMVSNIYFESLVCPLSWNVKMNEAHNKNEGCELYIYSRWTKILWSFQDHKVKIMSLPYDHDSLQNVEQDCTELHAYSLFVRKLMNSFNSLLGCGAWLTYNHVYMTCNYVLGIYIWIVI